jgi:hypothetical protein
MRTAGLVAFLATPALAEPPLTAEAFAAHIGTDTLHYAYSTGDRGSADYGPDGTLRWAFEGEPCFDGTWFARNDEICFAFSDGRLSACWHFVLDGTVLRGSATERASGDTRPLDIWETGRSAEPLACPPPEVGV